MSRLLWPTELMGLKRKHFTFKYFFRQAKNALNTKLCNDKVEFNHKNVLFIEKLILSKPPKQSQYALARMTFIWFLIEVVKSWKRHRLKPNMFFFQSLFILMNERPFYSVLMSTLQVLHYHPDSFLFSALQLYLLMVLILPQLKADITSILMCNKKRSTNQFAHSRSIFAFSSIFYKLWWC